MSVDDFASEELKNLRAALQDRAKETTRLLVATIGGSFIVFGYALGSKTNDLSVSVLVGCALVPALGVPFVMHWLASEFFSGQRMALYIRLISEPVLARAGRCVHNRPLAPFGWERLMAEWRPLRRGIDECRKNCTGCGTLVSPEASIFTKSPKFLALNMIILLSLLIATLLFATHGLAFPSAYPIWHRAFVPAFILVLCLVVNLVLRRLYIYPQLRLLEKLKTLPATCEVWKKVAGCQCDVPPVTGGA